MELNYGILHARKGVHLATRCLRAGVDSNSCSVSSYVSHPQNQVSPLRMGILEKIAEIEREMARTQRNKGKY